MIDRYEQKEISPIWSDKNKLECWQDSELSSVWAKEQLGTTPSGVLEKMENILLATPIDIAWWKAKDDEIHHDLQAFVEERLRWLPVELQQYFHELMTSFDTEDPAFARMLLESMKAVSVFTQPFLEALKDKALLYRYTPMNGRTHGQEAELQTFGKRCLTWFKEFSLANDQLYLVSANLVYSKMSGAIGNYGSVNPEVERLALERLGLKPFYGATQIMPRILYAPVADALCEMVCVLDKIAGDIRLMARSGRPLAREPFKPAQKGSSAMPHKRNPIRGEQMEGFARLARADAGAIRENIKTWEERAIEQSCVERVAWPDLFHIVVHCLKTMTGIIKKLKVYPDNMMREIVDLRGCHAASEAKRKIAQFGVPLGLSTEHAWRIVQLASFNVFEADSEDQKLRDLPPRSLEEAEQVYGHYKGKKEPEKVTIHELIKSARLHVSLELDCTAEQVGEWNAVLAKIFSNPETCKEWDETFGLSYLLKNEAVLYHEVFGV